MSPADLIVDYIFFQVCAFLHIPLLSESPTIDNLLIRLEALKSSFTSGLDLVGIFHSVAGIDGSRKSSTESVLKIEKSYGQEAC